MVLYWIVLFLCAEWEWWEKGGSSVPVYSMARSGGSWTSHSLPGLPQTGKSLQPPRRRTHCGPLQVTSTELNGHIYIQSDMQGTILRNYWYVFFSNLWPKFYWLFTKCCFVCLCRCTQCFLWSFYFAWTQQSNITIYIARVFTNELAQEKFRLHKMTCQNTRVPSTRFTNSLR